MAYKHTVKSALQLLRRRQTTDDASIANLLELQERETRKAWLMSSAYQQSLIETENAAKEDARQRAAEVKALKETIAKLERVNLRCAKLLVPGILEKGEWQ